jgi:transcriptional regulator with XRE-family HTH domain
MLASMSKSASPLGQFIRRQRELQELSMRQFADMAGISNPYLSQIERGIRAPSEAVLDAIAASLQTSAEALREEAGVAPKSERGSAVIDAIHADDQLTAAQRRALLEVYKSFTG